MSDSINASEWAERVKGPGKYEGEPAWVAFAWEEIVLGGCADDELDVDGITVSLVTLDAEVRAAFPDAPERAALYCREDGFVCQADYDRALALHAEECAASESEEAGEDE